MALYLIPNGPSPTTAAQAVVTTGTAIKTLLQAQASATMGLKIVEWGVSFDGSAAAAGIKVELLETAETAHAGDVGDHVDAAERVGGRGNRLGDRCLVGDVAVR